MGSIEVVLSFAILIFVVIMIASIISSVGLVPFILGIVISLVVSYIIFSIYKHSEGFIEQYKTRIHISRKNRFSNELFRNKDYFENLDCNLEDKVLLHLKLTELREISLELRRIKRYSHFSSIENSILKVEDLTLDSFIYLALNYNLFMSKEIDMNKRIVRYLNILKDMKLSCVKGSEDWENNISELMSIEESICHTINYHKVENNISYDFRNIDDFVYKI